MSAVTVPGEGTTWPDRTGLLWTGRILSAAAASIMFLSAVMKLLHLPQLRDVFSGRLGYAPERGDAGSFFVPLVVGLLVWAGVHLREERLRSLFPLRQGHAR